MTPTLVSGTSSTNRPYIFSGGDKFVYSSVCFISSLVGSSPCMTESDRLGRYKIRGGGGNISSVGIPSGSRVKVSIRCDMGATAQQSVTSQCSNGTWIPPWPRCGKQLALNDDFIFFFNFGIQGQIYNF